MNSNTATLLLHCEENGLASEYAVGGGENPLIVEYDAEGREVALISDLHIAAGLDANKRYDGTENFFNDDAFARFIDYLRSETEPGNGLLVINGDFVDFIRVVDLPESNEDFTDWHESLQEIGINKSVAELRGSISPKERELGFKTHDYKSAWRLWRASAGHSKFFDALARWLGDGQKLMVIKGNHDLEWYWPAVRNALRLDLAKRLESITGRDLEEILKNDILPHIDFIDDAVVIDTDLYIEHGHRYDKYTYVVGDPALPGDQELNIPFGSFFNRYLLNRLEVAYPYLDNVHPRQDLLPMLIRERFPLAMHVIFKHIPFMIRIIPKQYYRYMFSRFLTTILALLLPLIAGVVFLVWQKPEFLEGLLNSSGTSDSPTLLESVGQFITGTLGNVGWLILSYLLAQLLAAYQLEGGGVASLNKEGERILRNPDYRIVTMGHTHTPDQFEVDGRWFLNSGTWVPVVEASSASLRYSRTFCFIRLTRNESGRLQPDQVYNWDDAAGRPEPLAIVHQS